MSTMPVDPRLLVERGGLSGAIAGYRRRITSGDVGQLPVVIGLIVIWTIFGLASDGKFLTTFNITSLALQSAATGTIAVGVVFVLLLGEIDLTAGIVSGLASAVMAVLNVTMGVPGPVAVAAALVTGIAIGVFQGLWITKFRIPAFVVTLAGLIAWQGALLFVLGSTGTLNLNDGFIKSLAGTFFSGVVAWVLGALFVLYAAGTALTTRRSRMRAGLPAEPIVVLAIRVAIIAILVFASISFLLLGQDARGLPLSLVILIAVTVVMDFVARRTRFGRMIFAVGGNAEAARRAGIKVDRVRIAVFAMASFFSALGGVLAASRLLAVNQSAGSGDVLLNAIAAAVIGGTSLFGGRGTVWAALLGILVIQSISNGMDLLSFESSVKFMITGAVLLTAVTIDAVARRGREVSGK